MKKNKRIIFVTFLLFSMLFTNVIFAVNIQNPDAPSIPSSSGTGITKVTNATNKIWNTFAYIAQIIAIAAIVFAGLRYMFTSADQRADIKIQTIILILGAVLVFAAVPFATFVTNIVKNIL